MNTRDLQQRLDKRAKDKLESQFAKAAEVFRKALEPHASLHTLELQVGANKEPVTVYAATLIDALRKAALDANLQKAIDKNTEAFIESVAQSHNVIAEVMAIHLENTNEN